MDLLNERGTSVHVYGDGLIKEYAWFFLEFWAFWIIVRVEFTFDQQYLTIVTTTQWCYMWDSIIRETPIYIWSMRHCWRLLDNYINKLLFVLLCRHFLKSSAAGPPRSLWPDGKLLTLILLDNLCIKFWGFGLLGGFGYLEEFFGSTIVLVHKF